MFFLAFLGIDICVSLCFYMPFFWHQIATPNLISLSKTQGKVPEAVPKAKAKAKAQQTVPGFLVFLQEFLILYESYQPVFGENMKIEVCLEHLFLTRPLGAHDALRL